MVSYKGRGRQKELQYIYIYSKESIKRPKRKHGKTIHSLRKSMNEKT